MMWRVAFALSLSVLNTTSPLLMKYYGCVDVTDMPLKVFPSPEEFQHVSRVVFAALGIGSFTDEDEADTTVDEAKN